MPHAGRLGLPALPLRWRLVVAALVGAVGFAVGFGAFASWQIDRLEDRGLSSALQARLELVRGEVRTDGTLVADRPSPRTSLVQILNPDGSLRDSTPTLRQQGALVDVDAVRGAGSPGLERDVLLRHSRVALLAVPISLHPSAAGPGGTGVLVVGLDSEGFLTAREQLRYILVVGLGVVVPLAGLLAWALAGRALQTVTALTEEAEAVGVSDIGRGLAAPARDPELSRLVAALNRMLGRVADGLEHERRFAADASHRLRTPLATLRAEAELALADAGPAEMRRALEQVIADADNLTELVNRLLAAHRRGSAELLPLEEALRAATVRWHRQAGTAGLELECAYATGAGQPPSGAGEGGAPPGAAARGDVRVAATAVAVDGARQVDPALAGRRIDPHVLRSVLDPLVENAVQHTGPGGTVSLLVGAGDGEDVVVDVRDTGPGVAPQLRDRLFRPWTTTRSERGGAGLGLWLARESARAAGGDVALVDERPGRTTFRARLPLLP